jgi:hypothetical protein
MSVYNTNFYCRLSLGDGMVDRGTYAWQRRSCSSSSNSQSSQSRDDKTDEMLRRHEDMMQVNIFKYAFFNFFKKIA